MMRTLLSIFAFSALASATTYHLTVFAPGTDVDGALLNAAGQGFYAGVSGPATYCPQSVSNCPEVQGTLVHESMSGMAVTVPGGQKIFVSSTGQVQYVQAHSAYIPPGSFAGGWYNKTIVSDCEPNRDVVDFLSTDGSNFGGVKLCRDVPEFMAGTGASYVLYAATTGFNRTDCVDTLGLTLHGHEVESGCWQYI
ncbi:hypothetical protein AAE478_007345 [Parahypoxylon ruwenzoriense]